MPGTDPLRSEDSAASNHHNSSLFSTAAKLSPAQLKVAQALAEGKPVAAAARAAGVHRTTIHQWMRTQPAFTRALEEARTEYDQNLSDELAELAASALATLKALLEDPKTTPSVRLKTALAILERPRAPERSWTLPTTVESPEQRAYAEGLAFVEADAKAAKIAAAMQKSGVTPGTPAPPKAPRNAPCPCGSGLKYKRCCGGPNGDAKTAHDASPARMTWPKILQQPPAVATCDNGP
jgi:uncharacterized protein YecA (UPF0149 family)